MIRKYILEVMQRYIDAVEGACAEIGEFAEDVCADITRCGRFLLTGSLVFLIWLLLAVTMPVWYLPYKYFTGRRKKESKAVD